jgi:hypothetical protein
MNTPSNSIRAATAGNYRRFKIPIVCLAAALAIATPWLQGAAKGAAAMLAGFAMLVLSLAWWRTRQIDLAVLGSEESPVESKPKT